MNKNRLKREHAGNENDLNEVEKSDANLGQKAKFSILGVRFSILLVTLFAMTTVKANEMIFNLAVLCMISNSTSHVCSFSCFLSVTSL